MSTQTTQQPVALAIRFLREGFVPVEKKPEGFETMTTKEKVAWAQTVLEEKTDQELFSAMADFKDTDTNGYFDNTLSVEAIQDPSKFDTANESIYSTTAWDAFIDLEYEKNIITENQNFAHFIAELGFSDDDISHIRSGSTIPTSSKLKVLNKATKAMRETFRQEHGVMLVHNIVNDQDAPTLLKELIDTNNITYIGFDKVVQSEDYMPDHCIYIYLSGDILIGVQTSDKSYTWDDLDYEYGDVDIREEAFFSEVINSRNLSVRPVSQEEGAAAYRYLTKMMDELEEQDRSVFRDYILEIED